MITNGTVATVGSNLTERRNKIHFQEKHHHRCCGLRRSHSEHYDFVPRRNKNYDSIHSHLSIFDSLERSMFKRRPTRREYQVCVVETRYAHKVTENISKSKVSVKRKLENGFCKSPRSVLRDKSIADACFPNEKENCCPKRQCTDNRSTIDESICCRVLQSVGNDLIAPWLTPEELCNSEKAFKCKLDWGQAWHGGKVKNKKFASKVLFMLQKGVCTKDIIEEFNHDLVFSALWRILDLGVFIQLAYQYSHLKSIRRLHHLN
jgi:hypothetical protein